MHTKISDIFKKNFIDKEVVVCGWIKSVRAQKNLSFLHINDGSCFNNLQVIIDTENLKTTGLQTSGLQTGSSIKVIGTIVKSPAKGQLVEMQAKNIQVLGTCDPDEYPLQKKNHSFEFLRNISHIRPRTNTGGAVARVRSEAAYLTHKFFHENGFLWVATPILTSSDCEGAGEMFRVTTMPPKEDDFSKDFFKKPAFLTVSGQLNLESFACSLSNVYTFGPSFRAENSHTSRHLAEFWQLEPEIAFCDLDELIDFAEKYIKYLIENILKNCKEDMAFFDKFIEKGLVQKMEKILEKPFQKITYTEAVEILEKSKQKFEYPVSWGVSLQSEHERFLVEKHFHNVIAVTDYPKKIKAFYMRENEDKKTVAAVDILAPGIGEIVGGSQREERKDVLEKNIQYFNLQKEDYQWFLDLRKYGSVYHSGFGMGFERFLQFITGMENIRDVIPFPRTPGNISF